MPTKVILIDDDKLQIKDYSRALSSSGFEVCLISNTAGIRPLIDGHKHADASFFIVDMMMPCGDVYRREETGGGAFTGLFIARDLRRRFPLVPIVLWTAAHKEEILREAKKLSAETSNCRYSRKVDLSPSELTKELHYYVKNRRFRPRILKVLWKVAHYGAVALAATAEIKEITH